MKYLIYTLFIITFCYQDGYSQSKIEKAEESLSSKKRSSSRNDSSRNSSMDDISDFILFIDVFGHLIADAFLYSGYSVLIESPFEFENKSSHASLTKHPYHLDNKGNYSYDRTDSTKALRTTISSKYIFENSRVKGNHFNINLRFLKRLGLESNYLQLWEDNPNFGNHNLALYSFLAKYYRIRTETIDLWWGIGATYVDGYVNDWGFSYGLGLELFILNPVSIESNFNQTFINDDTVNKFNALLNYHYKTLKFSGGYEHLRIGTQNFSTILVGAGISF